MNKRTQILIVLIPLLFTTLVKAQFKNDKSYYRLGVQMKILDLAPLSVQCERTSGKLHLSLNVTYWKGKFTSFQIPERPYINSNYGYSVNTDFKTITIKPGGGYIYAQTPIYFGAISINLPLAFNNYSLNYTSEDNLLGIYTRNFNRKKLDIGIEFEQLSRYLLTNKIVVSGGFIAGCKLGNRNVFQQFPDLDSYYKYTPGIGYGTLIYFTGYVGLQYLIYEK